MFVAFIFFMSKTINHWVYFYWNVALCLSSLILPSHSAEDLSSFHMLLFLSLQKYQLRDVIAGVPSSNLYLQILWIKNCFVLVKKRKRKRDCLVRLRITCITYFKHEVYAHFYPYYGSGYSHNDIDLSPGQSLDGSFRKSNSGL